MSNANKYFLIEGGLAIAVSFVISSVVTAVFANAMHGKTNSEVHDACENEGSMFAGVFDVPESE